MPANFNWQAEDERGWDEFSSPEPPKQPRRRFGLKYLLAVIAILVVVSGGILLVQQLTDYVAETETSVETDVLTSQDLVLQAVNTTDPEVLVSVLSGREEDWTNAIISLLDRGLFFDREQFGLEWDRSVAPSNVDITISPDLRRAEVQFSLAYAYDSGTSQPEQVELLQTAIYRTSNDRWLLAPPLDEFWGDQISAAGRFITINFPGRDAELGRRLAADLEAALGSACSTLVDFSCPEDYQLRIILSTDPQVLADSADPELAFASGGMLALPTPTLLGIPTDDDGYRALQRAYAARAVRRMITDLNPWECCDQALFYDALTDSQLAQLGLQLWPFSPQDYLEVLHEPAKFDRLAQLWNNSLTAAEQLDEPGSWLVYSFIEFLSAGRIGASGAEMQAHLASTVNFYEWFHQILEMDYSTEYVEGYWNDYILQRIDAWQDAQGRLTPVPLPEQDIAMICDEGIVGSSNLYVYDPGSDMWSLALTNREIVHLGTIPGGNGVFLSDQLFRPDRIQTLIWRDGREIVIDEGHTVYRLTGRADPEYQLASLSGYDSQTFSSGHYILDISACTQDSCGLEQVEGSLLWSPDGTKSVFVDTSQGASIRIGDSTGESQQMIGQGQDPFWMDTDTIGYKRTSVAGIEIVSATVGISETQAIFQVSDVTELITGTRDADNTIFRATIQPVDPKRIIIAAGNRMRNQSYLIAYDWQRDEATVIYESSLSSSGMTSTGFSPDGRWLLIVSAAPDVSPILPLFDVSLYGLESGETQTLLPVDGSISPSLGWTADGKWLFQMSNGKIILTAPDEGYQYLILHGLNACRGAAWTNSQ